MEELQRKFEELQSESLMTQEESMKWRREVYQYEQKAQGALSVSAEEKARQADLYLTRKNDLVGDTMFLSVLGLALAWGLGSMTAAFSYVVGAAIGTGYLVLLAQFTGAIGKEDAGEGGASSGRFALVFFLVLLYGKNKDVLDILPMLGGFFTYQLSSVAQAFRE